jgi:hypothetical protein
VRWTFVKLSRQIGLRGPQDSHGPIADARTFCLPEMGSQIEDLHRRTSRKSALAAIG